MIHQIPFGVGKAPVKGVSGEAPEKNIFPFPKEAKPE
jgi:hypothetical protein